MAFGILVGAHVPVEISAWEVRKHHHQFFLTGNQLLQRHDEFSVLQLEHEHNFLLDVLAQVFLDDFAPLHTLKTVDTFCS